MTLCLQYRYILLCFLCAIDRLRAAEFPTTVQFDIIFPRNDTIYKPVYPFPVVFAIHNASAGWSQTVKLSWDIRLQDENWEPQNVAFLAAGEYGSQVRWEKKPDAPPDKYLMIDAIDGIINTTTRNLVLQYEVGISGACDEETGEVPRAANFDVIIVRGVRFSLDAENGIVPDLTDLGPCAVPVGAVGVEKVRSRHGIGSSGAECPVLAPGPQPMQPCAYPLNDTLATGVAARRLEHAQCPHQTWPNVTGLLRMCELEMSGQGKLWSDGTLAIMFVSFVVLSLL